MITKSIAQRYALLDAGEIYEALFDIDMNKFYEDSVTNISPLETKE